MGIVIRQSFRTLLVTYIGLVIGYVNALWLYPLILSEAEIGLIRLLINVSLLFATFASLGAINVPAKYFPYFDNKEKEHNGFLFFLILFSLFGFILFTSVFIGFKSVVYNIYSQSAALLVQYFYFFIPFTIIILFISLFKSYLVIQQKPVLPNFVNEVLVRVFIVAGMLCYFYSLFKFRGFVVFVLIGYGISLIVILFYTRSLGVLFLKPNFSIFKSRYLKELLIFGGFSLLGNASSLIIMNIDGLMISAYKGLGQTGIYTIAFFIATVIEIPKRSLSQSVISLVSAGNKNNEIHLLDTLYKKSSINQLIIGALIFIGIWANITNIFNMMPHTEIYIQGKWVVFFIGLGKLFDLATGINGEILGTSKYYKFDLVFLVALGVVAIFTNMIFIPIYGITGAALASALSVFAFNTARYFFILGKMKIQPFTVNTIKVLLICAGTLVFNYIIPTQKDVLIDTITRSLLITLVFGGLVLLTKSSEDINVTLYKILNLIKTKLK